MAASDGRALRHFALRGWTDPTTKTTLCALALFLVPLALMAQTLPGGFRAAYVEGNVVGSDTGKPLAGAKIDVIGIDVKDNQMKANDACGAGFALSSSNGNFAVGVGESNMCVSTKHPFNGKYYVLASKRGYLRPCSASTSGRTTLTSSVE